MPNESYHVAPLVEKTNVSLVVLESSSLEATAIRSALECFNFRVDTHWIGSRKEFVEILSGKIPTQDLIIISNHGDEEKGMYTCPEEAPIQGAEIGQGNLSGKSVISLGCFTGADNLVSGFKQAGCLDYVAPEDAPFGTTALLFAIHVCYQISQHKKALQEAVEIAASYDDESGMFKYFGFK